MSPTRCPAVCGDPARVDATTDTRLGVADLGGLIVWAVSLCLLLVGVAADNGGDGVAGGPGLAFYLLGTLAMFTSLCWSLASMAAAAARLNRDGGTAVTSLWLNASAWFGTALVIGTVWASYIS
jgi:hypothetical protein